MVTGPPDGGGRWLSNTPDPPSAAGFLVVSFASLLYDGPGADIRVYDVANDVREVVNIFVSLDGIVFTPVGQLNSVNNTLDINGAFSGFFRYIMIQNASTLVSMDVDAVEGLNVDPAPEPASVVLIATGLGVVAWRRRRS